MLVDRFVDLSVAKKKEGRKCRSSHFTPTFSQFYLPANLLGPNYLLAYTTCNSLASTKKLSREAITSPVGVSAAEATVQVGRSQMPNQK